MGGIAVVGTQLDRVAGEGKQLLGAAQQVEQFGMRQRIEHLAPFGAADNKTALAQAGQVARNSALSETEGRGQVHHAQLARSQLAYDRQPGAVGKSVEKRCSTAQPRIINKVRCYRHIPMIA